MNFLDLILRKKSEIKKKKLILDNRNFFTAHHLNLVLNANFDLDKARLFIVPNCFELEIDKYKKYPTISSNFDLMDELPWYGIIGKKGFESYLISKENLELIIFNPFKYLNNGVLEKINPNIVSFYGNNLGSTQYDKDSELRINQTALKYDEIKKNLNLHNSFLFN